MRTSALSWDHSALRCFDDSMYNQICEGDSVEVEQRRVRMPEAKVAPTNKHIHTAAPPQSKRRRFFSVLHACLRLHDVAVACKMALTAPRCGSLSREYGRPPCPRSYSRRTADLVNPIYSDHCEKYISLGLCKYGRMNEERKTCAHATWNR